MNKSINKYRHAHAFRMRLEYRIESRVDRQWGLQKLIAGSSRGIEQQNILIQCIPSNKEIMAESIRVLHADSRQRQPLDSAGGESNGRQQGIKDSRYLY